MVKTILLIIIIAGAGTYLVRRYVRIFQGKCSSCDSCSVKFAMQDKEKFSSCSGNSGSCALSCTCGNKENRNDK